ncbi:MAG: methyltransferase domain-containing protein [Eubacteriaceae bacterium]
MTQKYHFNYNKNTPYYNIIQMMEKSGIKQGVHLDIGCGYAAIRFGIIESEILNQDYIGVDGDSETVEILQKEGVEAFCYILSNKNDGYEKVKEILKGREIASISIIDVLEHLINPEEILELIHRLATEYNAPVFLSVPNISHEDITFKLMEGKFDYTPSGLLDDTHLNFFTESRLSQLMRELGFEEHQKNDFLLECSDQHFPKESTVLSSGALCHQYLKWLKKLMDPNGQVNQFLRTYRAVEIPVKVEGKEKDYEPFLSIITRTQGMRREALEEVLLCLTGQTNRDFEVLIMGHNLDAERKKNVEEIISNLPAWIQKRVTLHKVDGGNRTTPLNRGFTIAKGRYISILDDDDLVMDNWVDEFYKLATKNPGSVLHAYSVAQKWMTVDVGEGEQALRAVSEPMNIYCRDFNWLEQLTLNYCPTMSYACPRYAFQEYNICFDESLTTVEDWDFLMRTVFVCGIHDTDQVTSIYRLWTNNANSQTLHDREEWLKNEKKIKEHFNNIPIVLPKGAVSQIKETIFSPKMSGNSGLSNLLATSALYLGDGDGFTERIKFSAEQSDDPNWKLSFTELEAAGNVLAVRFDPVDNGNIMIENFKMKVVTSDNKSSIYTGKDIRTNGFFVGNQIVFIKDDPQIILPLKSNVVLKEIRISCGVEFSISEEVYDIILTKLGKKVSKNPIKSKDSVFYKGSKKVYKKIKKMLK